MNRGVALRAVILAAVLLLLDRAGIVPLHLPWGSPDFQASGATVLVYLVWSVAGARFEPGTGRSPARIALYIVLLVGAVDCFVLMPASTLEPHLLLRGLIPVRWAGVAMLAAGSVMHAFSGGEPSRFRVARMMQMDGIALGFGSLLGLAAGIVPGMLLVLRDRLQDAPEDACEGPGSEG
jgi:hypothetical protein